MQTSATETLPLAGTWELQEQASGPWRPISVPLPWEWAGIPKDAPGPFSYRRRLSIPQHWQGKRLWLECDAVSHHARVLVDGQAAGEHTGSWDAWSLELTPFLRAGSEHELSLIVEKPASLTNGPDSPPVPGNYPLRETLSGFLPYVWGHAFGGIWQDLRLSAGGPARLGDVHASGSPDGLVRIEARVDGLCAVRAEILDDSGRVLASDSTPAAALASLELRLSEPRAWTPQDPQLYRARVSVECDGQPSDQREVTFGLRRLSVDGTRLLLNDSPLYPRFALSWGWYPDEPPASPSPDTVREEFKRLKARGFNGVKLCLWQPPEHYFRLADETGMLLWLELPLWLPRMTPRLSEQVFREYDALVRQARNHPSVILYTLGCELNTEAGADILEPLYRQVKGLVGDALLRDNSGSGEAYGGLLDEYAEFRDYHFYSELEFFRPLVEHFSPDWRPAQPWLFGEYADTDSFRDPRDLTPSGEQPWWASPDAAMNPVGARWQHDLPYQEERLRANGLLARAPELVAASWRQSLLHRKWTLEATRAFKHVSGYVITGLVDTPISTAGLWDDRGRAKASPEQYRAFNDDLVLLAGFDRRRDWIAGGDRPAYWDNHSYPAGARARAHAVLSNYSQESGLAEVEWALNLPTDSPLPGGEGLGEGGAAQPHEGADKQGAASTGSSAPARLRAPTLPYPSLQGGEKSSREGSIAAGRLTSANSVAPGELAEVGVAEFTLPAVEAPLKLELAMRACVGACETSNAWPLWVFPPDPWRGVEGVALLDPSGELAGLRKLAPDLRDDLGGTRVALATTWTPELEAFLRAGGAAVLTHARGTMAGPLAAVAVPWWREAVKLIEPHPAWGDFPHEGWADLQFYSLAPDQALDASALPPGWRPILRRVDARTCQVLEYALELDVGRGRLIVTTLRFAGGLGDEALGIERSPAASHLLANFTRHLLGEKP